MQTRRRWSSTIPKRSQAAALGYCTHILQSGINVREVQYIMGHADPTMTMGVYNHFIEEEQRDPASERIRACL
ncbi:MAG: tyrosine-type recombinase/integrase [Oscillospiraceae bacterium]|nr:tyrosine-type recombinase/integrase [Oscillospiraceae bacterium]